MGFGLVLPSMSVPFYSQFWHARVSNDSGTTCIVSSLWLDFFFRTFDITTQGGLIVCGAGNETYLHVRLQTPFETQVRMPKDVAAVLMVVETAIPSATICWRQHWITVTYQCQSGIHHHSSTCRQGDMMWHVRTCHHCRSSFKGFLPGELRWFPSARVTSPACHGSSWPEQSSRFVVVKVGLPGVAAVIVNPFKTHGFPISNSGSYTDIRGWV